MDIKRTRTPLAILYWTKRDILVLFILTTIPTVAYHSLDVRWLALPWLPIALVGTAVSFIIGFKNNASYGRSWEARQIWGGIVNVSRSWAATLINYLAAAEISEGEKEAIYLRLINRHIAWLTALRFQLREFRQWEAASERDNAEFRNKSYVIEEHDNSLSDELQRYLTATDFETVNRLHSKSTQILALQSRDVGQLRVDGAINDLQQIDLQNTIDQMYDFQGGSERIKNFPYPRQYATLNLFYVRIFTFLLPFGMLRQFEDSLGRDYVWLTIPFAVLVGWIFTTMEKIGEASENPFEGGTNDIPITQISRNIEIDLLEMIRVPHELKPKQPQSDVLT